MDFDFGFYSKVASEVLGAPTPARESERLLDLAELQLTDHDDPALASLCTLLTNLFNVPLAGAPLYAHQPCDMPLLGRTFLQMH